MRNLTEAEMQTLATTTTLSYDQVAALADKAERAGVTGNILSILIEVANDFAEATEMLEEMIVMQEQEARHDVS